eukprot:GHVL01028730.1.p1 GENE.GHVL01028730.1~~GHVL01028730.1.p1  ORF type:complete len:2463 (+),score=365.97 GHVL01028730.1:121-7509(+)
MLKQCIIISIIAFLSIVEVVADPSDFEPSFTIVGISPEPSNDEVVQLSGKRPITIAFNLPIISLGADFDQPLPDSELPAKLVSTNSEDVAGRWYFVSTSIIRFDPENEWPTDLHIKLELNLSVIRSVSGQSIGADAKVPGCEGYVCKYSTPELSASAGDVFSLKAMEVTGNIWQSSLGNMDDSAHECPDDCQIKLWFSHKVQFTPDVVASFVEVLHERSGNTFPVYLSPCSANPTPMPRPYEIKSSSDKETSEMMEKTCVMARIDQTKQALETGEIYVVRTVPKTTYHPVAGPVQSAVTLIKLTGLRPFILFPRVRWGGSTSRYNRLQIYLRHGLSDELYKNPDLLLNQITIAPPVTPLSAKFPNNATLELEGPFVPDQMYNIAAEGNSNILDGFGLPLEESSKEFRSNEVTPAIVDASQSLFPSDAFMASKNENNLSDWVSLVQPPVQSKSETGMANAKALWLPIRSEKDLHTALLAYFTPLWQRKGDLNDLYKQSISKILYSGAFETASKVQESVVSSNGEVDSAYSGGAVLDKTSLEDELQTEHYLWYREIMHKRCGFSCRDSVEKRQFIQKTSFHVSVVVQYEADGKDRSTLYTTKETVPIEDKDTVIVSVRDLITDDPLSGATVQVWDVFEGDVQMLDPINSDKNIETDINGIANVSFKRLKKWGHRIVLVILYETSWYVHTESLNFETGCINCNSEKSPLVVDDLKVKLVTDRGVYKPTANISLAGWVAVRGGKCHEGTRFVCMPSDAIPAVKELIVLVQFQWQAATLASKPGATPPLCTVEMMEVNTELGTFSSTFTIPAESEYGYVNSINVYYGKPNEGLSISSGDRKLQSEAPFYAPIENWRYRSNLGCPDASSLSQDYKLHLDQLWNVDLPQILISSPRPPTAILTGSVTATAVRPEAIAVEEFEKYPDELKNANCTLAVDLPVVFNMSSYTGIPLQNHTISVDIAGRRENGYERLDGISDIYPIKWRTKPDEESIKTIDYSVEDQTVSLKVEMTTDLNGQFSKSLHVPCVSDSTAITLKATTLGLTGELLELAQPATTQISYTSYAIEEFEIDRDERTLIPGIPFHTRATAKALGETSKVEMSIQLIKPEIYITNCALLLQRDPTTGAVLDGPWKVIDRCIVPSASAEAKWPCHMTLPSMGKFLLLAQIEDDQGTTVECKWLGRDEKEWTESPLTKWSPASISLTTDKKKYSPGDKLNIMFVNPFPHEAHLLVVWDAGKIKQETIPASQEVSVVIGDVTDYCTGSCPAVFILTSGLKSSISSEVFDRSREIIASLPKSIALAFLTADAAAETVGPLAISQIVNYDVDGEKAVWLEPTVNLRAVDGTLQPGAAAVVEVSVDNLPESLQDGDATAEAWVVVVDKGYLDLTQHEIRSPSKYFSTTPNGRYPTYFTSLNSFTSVPAYKKAADLLFNRAKRDPWIASVLKWDMRWPQDLDLSDSKFFSSYASKITDFPNNYRSYTGYFEESFTARGGAVAEDSMIMFAAAPMADEDMNFKASARSAPTEGDGDTAQSVAPTYVRSNFEPLVNSQIVKLRFQSNGQNGEGKMLIGESNQFELPDQLTTFTVRAVLTSAPKPYWGVAEAQAKSTLPIYQKPYVPRFFRQGDVSYMGVVITTDKETLKKVKTVRVTTTIDSCAAVSSNSAQHTTAPMFDCLVFVDQTDNPVISDVTLSKTTETFLLPFRARTIAESVKVRFALEVATERRLEGIGAGEGFKDEVIVDIPILAAQSEVVLATTTAIDGRDEGITGETQAVSLPDVIAGMGQLSITAGVGHAAAINSISDAFALKHFDLNIDGTERRGFSANRPPGDALLAAILTAHVLEDDYGVEMDPKTSLTAKAALVASQLIDSYTSPTLGFMYQPDDEKHNKIPDVDLNSLAVYVSRFVGHQGDRLKNEETWAKARREGLQRRADIAYDNWRNSCNESSSRGACEAFDVAKSIGYYTIALARLSFGASGNLLDETSHPLNIAWNQEMSIQRLVSTSDKMPTTAQLLLAKSCLDEPIVFKQFPILEQYVLNLADESHQTVRIQTSGYVSVSPESASPASDMVQSLVLRLWARSAALGGYVSWAVTGNRPSNLMAFESLAAVTAFPNSSKVSLYVAQGGQAGRSPWVGVYSAKDKIFAVLAMRDIDVNDNSNKPDEVEFTVGSAPQPLWATKFNQVSPGPNTHVIQWSNVPEDQKLPLVVAGDGTVVASISMIFIPKEIPKNSFFKGILVEKTFQRANGNNCDGPSLNRAVSGNVLCVTLQITSPDALGRVVVEDLVPSGLEPIDPNLSNSGVNEISFRWFPSFSTHVHEDSVRFVIRNLQAGSHTFVYKALVNLPGTFQLPPARAYQVENPQVMGRSASNMFCVVLTTSDKGGCSDVVSAQSIRGCGDLPAGLHLSVLSEGAVYCNASTGNYECVDPEDHYRVKVGDECIAVTAGGVLLQQQQQATSTIQINANNRPQISGGRRSRGF